MTDLAQAPHQLGSALPRHTQDILALPSVPTAYAMVALDFAVAKGCKPAEVIEGCGFDLSLLADAQAKLTTYQSTALMARVQALTQEQALGYELGLRTSFTAHGMLGLGVMSSSHLLEALSLGMQYFRLKNLTFGLQWQVMDEHVELAIVDHAPHAPMRRTATEWLVIALARTGYSLLAPTASKEQFDGTGLSFPWPEPSYHGRFAHVLKHCQFGAPAASLRFPLKWLMQRLPSAAPTSVQLVKAHCEQELPLAASAGSCTEQVRAALARSGAPFPDLAGIASSLNTSPSTLKRRLQQEGQRFSELLQQACEREACHLLESSTLRIEQIAERLGYENAANFSRAFRKWKNDTPLAWRERIKEGSALSPE